jgi:glycosyltransferase involved in cell wall biosynthesis
MLCINDKKISIAILIPCFNEEITVGKVVTDFRKAIPSAEIYVFDNSSTDKTAQIANENGAVVIREKKRGKGYVVQSMFQKIKADYYVMVDGDDTYPAEKVHDLLEVIIQDHADMAVGNRLYIYEDKAFGTFHILGNNLVRLLVNRFFDASLKDIMSGYRAMKHEVIQGITVVSKGFEVETEITLQCLNKGFVIKEIDVPYRKRPQGSHSKLRTLSDGFLVIKAIFIIFRDYKPLSFFGLLAILLFSGGLLSGFIVVREFLETRYITHVPLTILSVGLGLSGMVMIGIGIILESIKNRFDELYAKIMKIADE